MTRIVWFWPIYSIKPNRTIARTALCESSLCEDLLYSKILTIHQPKIGNDFIVKVIMGFVVIGPNRLLR